MLADRIAEGGTEMRNYVTVGVLAAALALAACGGGDEPEKNEEPMKVEDTVFGPLVGTPEKVEDRANAAVEVHREKLDERLEQDEGS
jgi:hypothetical protein